MNEPIHSPVAQSLMDSLDTMAFVSLAPVETPCALPADLVRVGIDFTGGLRGRLELAAPAAFGALLSANMLGCEPSDPDATTRAADAMKELMNVTCGDLLARLGRARELKCDMGLPQLDRLEDMEAWQAHVESHPDQVFDAEGHIVAIWLRGVEI